MSTKIYNMTDHWTDAATSYTSIKMNVMDDNSDVSSRLMDLKKNGLSEFAIDKLGKIIHGSIDIPHVNNLEETITALSAAGLTNVDFLAATVADLTNLAYPADSLAFVYGDPVADNNDYYYKVGASGTGSWVKTDLVPTLVEQITPRKQVARTFYVAMNGSDSNHGRSIYKPFQTIGAALTAAGTLVSTEGEGPCVVIVHPGEYEVAPETEIPPRVALYGYDARVTKLTIASGQEQNNMFLLNSGCKVRGFTFTGLRHESDWVGYPNESNPLAGNLDRGPPKKGYAFAFKPGAYITRSPYIGDCAVLHNLTYQEMSAPQDRENGNVGIPMTGGNLYADGSVCDPDSPLRSVVVDSFTAVNPNGVAYAIVNNALVQLVSVFTNWSRVGIWAHTGGQVTIVNSNATFGDYAFASTGFRYIVNIPSVGDDNLAQCTGYGEYIRDNVNTIADYLVNTRYPAQIANWNTAIASNPTYAALALRDTKTILTETAEDLLSGQDKSTRFWLQSLFTTETYDDYSANAVFVFDTSLTTYFAQSFDQIRQELKYRTTTVPAEVQANTMLENLFQLANNVINDPLAYTTVFQSKIEAASHQFSYAGSGVNYNALPYGQRATGQATVPTSNLYTSNGGVIYATFNTEAGDTYLGKDLRIDFERSTIEGQAFARGVQNITLPLIVGIGG